MTESVADIENASPSRPMGLFARIAGVIVSPRQTYAEVAQHPRALGVLAVTILVMAAVTVMFLSTDAGKNALLEQQMRMFDSLRARGLNVPDAAYQGLEAGIDAVAYTTAGWIVIAVPLFCAVVAGVLLALFTAILGGGATFRQVFAVVAHSTVISALQTLFGTPISYATGDLTSPTRLAVFFPMLDPASFFYRLTGAIDLFQIWAIVSLAIGLSVLYGRRTGSIASGLLGCYAVFALARAVVGF